MTNLFKLASQMGHEQVVFCQDQVTGLKAIIAIHDTTLGPALGGCRFWNYESEDDALNDVLRLSRGMTYKAAVAGLNLGGGKAVLFGDPQKLKSEALFRAFGRFVNSLGGRYITAEDVNINVDDMEYVALETKYVTGISTHAGSGDPSPYTALGVLYGMKAAVKHRLKRDSLAGLTVSVQGVGHVGYNLCKLLASEKVNLIVSDINAANTRKVQQDFGAQIAENDHILAEKADIFSPCAMGAVLNDETLPMLKAKIVAGAANNQLAEEQRHGQMVQELGILYCPDYVINAGGLINVSHELRGYDPRASEKDTAKIYDTLLKIFEESDRSSIPTHIASDRFAEKRIREVKAVSALNQSVKNQNWIDASRK